MSKTSFLQKASHGEMHLATTLRSKACYPLSSPMVLANESRYQPGSAGPKRVGRQADLAVRRYSGAIDPQPYGKM
jgi:hypothetical protein